MVLKNIDVTSSNYIITNYLNNTNIYIKFTPTHTTILAAT